MLINGSQASATLATVTGAIRNAARATGASFEYLLATARAESGLNPQANAKTSTARGLFQFIDRTWLAMLKEAGPSLGYERYAVAISRSADGHYEVADPAMRQQIFALRDDPVASAAMAGAFTQHNAGRLAETIGRHATDGELYMAHFLGADGAGRLIALAGSDPRLPAAGAFPKAAAANPGIFYDRAGNARSVSEVYAILTSRFDRARGADPAAVAASQAPPVAPAANAILPAVSASPAAPAPAPPRSLFNDMFTGEPRREPVSQIVRELWATRPHVAAALSGAASAVPAADASNATAATLPGARWRNFYRDLPAGGRALVTSRPPQ